MSLLAHAAYGAPHMEREKRNLTNHIAQELQEAKRIQQQLGCTWGVALRLASLPVRTVNA